MARMCDVNILCTFFVSLSSTAKDIIAISEYENILNLYTQHVIERIMLEKRKKTTSEHNILSAAYLQGGPKFVKNSLLDRNTSTRFKIKNLGHF